MRRPALVITCAAFLATAVSAGAASLLDSPRAILSSAASTATLAGVDRGILKRLGPGYACTVSGPRGGRPVTVWVVDADAATRARRLAAGYAAGSVRVRRTSPRLAFSTMERIRREIERTRPRDRQDSGVDFESPLGARHCPRVQIFLKPIRLVSAPLEHWAEQAVRWYGTDRVVIERVPFSNRVGRAVDDRVIRRHATRR